MEPPASLLSIRNFIRVDYDPDPRIVAYGIVHKLDLPWRAEDGLPFNPHLFSLENDIATFFQDIARHKETLFEAQGAPPRDTKCRRFEHTGISVAATATAIVAGDDRWTVLFLDWPRGPR